MGNGEGEVTQEDIIELRDKNCPHWLCDSPSQESMVIRIRELEEEVVSLRIQLLKAEWGRK